MCESDAGRVDAPPFGHPAMPGIPRCASCYRESSLWYPRPMAWVSPRNVCTLALVAIALAVASTGALALAGLGHRWAWWGHRAGFAILKWTVVGLVLAAVLGV